jgi:hypothetical protein
MYRYIHYIKIIAEKARTVHTVQNPKAALRLNSRIRKKSKVGKKKVLRFEPLFAEICQPAAFFGFLQILWNKLYDYMLKFQDT